jgi:hypothetical protein
MGTCMLATISRVICVVRCIGVIARRVGTLAGRQTAREGWVATPAHLDSRVNGRSGGWLPTTMICMLSDDVICDGVCCHTHWWRARTPVGVWWWVVTGPCL